MTDRERLFNDNIKLAYYVANRYRTREDFEDIRQICLAELWNSTKRYEAGEVKFGTYALRCIELRVKEYTILESCNISRGGHETAKAVTCIMRNKDKDRKDIWKEIESNNIRVSYNTFCRIYEIVKNGYLRMDDGDIDIKDDYVNVEKEVENKDLIDKIVGTVKNCSMTEKNKKIFLRYMELCMDKERVNMSSLGREFGLSRERTRQVVNSGRELIKRKVKV